MRACTACVTEISYNYEEQPYSAEIEFITAEDWAKELKVLFQDLLDGSGNVSRDCTNEDSDAGVAYAKIKAVYPQKTKEDISQSSIDRMLKEISHILGTKRNIKGTDSLKFYKQLQTFVDSKEKSTGQGQKQKREREFWPLIRVVRLYVKSPALATGAVIVDLPGYVLVLIIGGHGNPRLMPHQSTRCQCGTSSGRRRLHEAMHGVMDRGTYQPRCG